MDVEEIDCALYRGIDDIRALRQRIYYMPLSARFRVYILDEAHQLTPDAFSALLKPLEEPPAHAYFVLATTDASDIPPTVLSRVQRFDFRAIATDVITARLQHILTEEKIPFDGKLSLIASNAGGQLRDAIKSLQRAINDGNGQVKRDGHRPLSQRKREG